MTGEYFEPRRPVSHKCHRPEPSTLASQGWRCECGRAYVIEHLPARDVNPGELPVLVPDPDNVLAQKLALEHDADSCYREVANKWDLRGERRPIAA